MNVQGVVEDKPGPLTVVPITRVPLELREFMAGKVLCGEGLRMGSYPKMTAECVADTAVDLVVVLRSTLLCRPVTQRTSELVVGVPATWWQHLKMAAFPGWLLRWFPVAWTNHRKTVTFEAVDLLPDVSLELDSSYGRVVRFALTPVETMVVEG